MGAAMTIAITIFGSTGFWQLLMRWIDSRSAKHTRQQQDMDTMKANNAEILKSIKLMSDRQDSTDAKNSRIRILRFNDELLQDQHHSKEYFDIVLDDIQGYENYCCSHPEFKNGKTIMAVANIKRCYQKCMEQREFIKE